MTLKHRPKFGQSLESSPTLGLTKEVAICVNLPELLSEKGFSAGSAIARPRPSALEVGHSEVLQRCNDYSVSDLNS